MRPMALSLAVVYLRLSDDEKRSGESSSIINQRMIIEDYCQRNHITVIREFVDDGFSGGNFLRPGFQEMLVFLEQGQANTVITKDLSRLGRDMREASYYAEQFFPEHGIRYLAPNDGFDSQQDNPMAPFQFAMNEMYLRDGSKKIRNVLQIKREKGQYCACPPYGYKKAERESRLVPDEQTAPIVQKIFQWAADGYSSRKIAIELDAEGIMPPLKYRALYRDDFSEQGAARIADTWNWTTVKRILRNKVYLGHTLLGKTKKVSVKSKRKVDVPEEDWAITPDTHEKLVSQDLYDRAQKNLANQTRAYKHTQEPIRKSIFGKLVYCSKCGYAMCSGGSVYKGEREKYWYLACNNIRYKDERHCDGVRVRYTDFMEIVRQDLSQVIAFSHEELMEMAQEAIELERKNSGGKTNAERVAEANGRILAIDKIVSKLYTDNANGKLSDERLDRMVLDLERESTGLQKQLKQWCADTGNAEQSITERFDAFYQLAKEYTQVHELTRDILLTFIDRIEVGPKILPEGIKLANQHVSYQQEITIYYKFIGALHHAPRNVEALNQRFGT